jgi:hypothetical protein
MYCRFGLGHRNVWFCWLFAIGFFSWFIGFGLPFKTVGTLALGCFFDLITGHYKLIIIALQQDYIFFKHRHQ